MKNYNAKWYYEQKMTTKPYDSVEKPPKFNASQRSFVIKMMREFAEMREAMQRELCALQGIKNNCTQATVKEIRTAYPMLDEIYSLRQQQAVIRKQYLEEFDLVKEFQCLGKYLGQLGAVARELPPFKKYIVRIFSSGKMYVYNPDKPSHFYESTFTGNAANLSRIKKTLYHLHDMEASEPVLSNLNWTKQ
jgi:hypothetical protein